MFELPRGRISGAAFHALIKLVRSTPAHRLTAQVLRKQLGIDDLKLLPDAARLPLPTSLLPIPAHHEHTRHDEGLGAPKLCAVNSSADYHARFTSGELDPRALCERAFTANRELSQQSPSLAPLSLLAEAGATQAAYAAAERFRTGKSLGPLDGVPVVIKEEVDFQGLPTRLGTGWMPHAPATRDATCVARLRAAGAVLLGQTPMTEYGLSPLGVNTNRLMPRNPHSPAHLAGGSSTGSGVAVAIGVSPVALGVDGGGSIRVPAAFTGVFGLKPSFGRIPLTGHGSRGGSSVAHAGPIGASSYDLAAFLEIAAGACPGDPASLAQPAPTPGEWLSALGRGVRGLRVGVIESEWDHAAHEVSAAGQAALKALEELGAELVPVKLSLAAHASAIGYLTIGLESYASLRVEREERLSQLGPDVQLLLRGMSVFESDDYLDAQRLRHRLREQTAALLRQVDVLALPTTASVAPPVTDDEAASGFLDPPALSDACRFSFLANLTGTPAGTAPIGTNKIGLPIGLQLVADAYDEATVLQVLAALERAEIASVKRPASYVDLLG